MTDLASRLARVPGIWQAGMRWTRPADSPWFVLEGRLMDGETVPEGAVPDLSDPATVGALFAHLQALLEHDGVDIIVETRWAPGTGFRVVRWLRSTGQSWRPETVGGMGRATRVEAIALAILEIT